MNKEELKNRLEAIEEKERQQKKAEELQNNYEKFKERKSDLIIGKAHFSPKQGLWKPKNGEIYYYIQANGLTSFCYWADDGGDNVYLYGNCYRTKEEAEQKIAELKAIQDIKIYIAENFPFEPDWEDEDERKYYITYDFCRKVPFCDYWYWTKYYSPFGCLKSREDCKQLIKDKEAELRIIFNI